jgi:hypothetical protein
MARSAFLATIASDTATLSGGSWQATLPLANVKTASLATVARSTNDDTASTILNVDFGTATACDAVILCRHNLDATATWRIRASANSDLSSASYDSGWVNAWPEQWATGVLPANHPNASTRRLTTAQIRALDPPRDAIHLLPSVITARYWRIEIDDTTNIDGYVQIARLLMGALYRPTYPANPGVQFGYDDPSVIKSAYSGARFVDVRPKMRRVNGTIGPITQAESVSVLLELQAVLGVGGQLYWLFDPTDAPQLQRTSFLATFRQMSSVEYAAAGWSSFPFALDEVL